MTEHTARSAVRLIAVVTILIGLVLTTMTLLGILGVSSSMASAAPGIRIEGQGLLGKVGLWTVMMHVSIAVWGFLLWAASPALARRIVE